MKKNIAISATLISALLIGLGIYTYSESRLEKMVGQMIMTGFHGDGAGENAENFNAITRQIKRGQIGGIILFDVDISGLVAQGMTIPEAKQHIF